MEFMYVVPLIHGDIGKHGSFPLRKNAFRIFGNGTTPAYQVGLVVRASHYTMSTPDSLLAWGAYIAHPTP